MALPKARLKTTLWGALFIVLAAIVFAWVAGGGAGRIVSRVLAFQNPFTTSWDDPSDIMFGPLPWQVELPRGADVLPGVPTEDRLERLESEYTDLAERVREAKTFGSPSPHSGSVFLWSGAAAAGDAESEYLEISSEADVSLEGWSLQSMVSGVRVGLPQGTETLSLGSVPASRDIALHAGDRAVVSTGRSPVGISFRENVCTGYLEQYQGFAPPLMRSCPSPREEMPLTSENLHNYGSACVDFVSSLPSCTFYTGLVPSSAPASCDRFIRDVLSYNGCVGRHRSDGDFFLPAWRVFLDSPTALWDDSHDVIRLLDSAGRTVDVVSY